MAYLRRHLLSVLAALFALALVGTLIFRTTSSLFSSTTDNPSNSWQTGSVIISDDDSSTAMFTTAGNGLLTGGQALTNCIKVNYTGTSTTGVGVKFYGAASGALAQYLDVKVEVGTGGGFGDCTGFSGSQIFNNTLQNLNDNVNAYSNGVGSWTPSSSSDSRVYRITVTVQQNSLAQAKSAAGSFTWEAQG
jgi:hypothetical protein